MAVAPAATSSVSEALQRMGGMYGSAWRDGLLLSEVIQVVGTVELAQIDVALVGQTKLGHKTGREQRSGTLDMQKIDSYWEMQVYNFMSQSLAQRRANRDAGHPGFPSFQLLIENDDPDALGIEKWQLDGCQIYRINLGFNIADDLTTFQVPFTWETETPIYAFTRGYGPGGVAIPVWYPNPGGGTFGPPA
jgi:hypothetical protein